MEKVNNRYIFEVTRGVRRITINENSAAFLRGTSVKTGERLKEC